MVTASVHVHATSRLAPRHGIASPSSSHGEMAAVGAVPASPLPSCWHLALLGLGTPPPPHENGKKPPLVRTSGYMAIKGLSV